MQGYKVDENSSPFRRRQRPRAHLLLDFGCPRAELLTRSVRMGYIHRHVRTSELKEAVKKAAEAARRQFSFGAFHRVQHISRRSDVHALERR